MKQIKAHLITKEGFSKTIEVSEFRPYLKIAKVPKLKFPFFTDSSLLENEVTIETMEFQLEEYVQSSKLILGIYKEI